jgi:hypothetical protein
MSLKAATDDQPRIVTRDFGGRGLEIIDRDWLC